MRRLHLLIVAVAFLAACAPAASSPSTPTLYVLRTDRPALLQLDSHYQPSHEFPLPVPDGCALDNVYPSPRGLRLAIELTCSFGQAVVWMDAASGQVKQPVTDSDSHLLAWAPLGDALYLKVGTIDRPRVVRVDLMGAQQTLPLSELTYDLSPKPGGGGLLYAFSRGLALGSELWFARADGTGSQRLAADAANYLSLARWSPDGSQIAIIKIPDSATPFTVGELWLFRLDGSAPRRLAQADAGHGYPPAWSPDGKQIAFVVRQNPRDSQADSSAPALISDLHAVTLVDGAEQALTDFDSGRVDAPAWQPDGNMLAFTHVLNDRMTVYIQDVLSGKLQQVDLGPVCCPAWLRQ